MIVRVAQLNVAEKSAETAFQQRLLSHVEEFFPVHYRVVGRERLCDVIEVARNKSKSFCFESERDIYLYLSLMLYLGSHFDRDPQIPWALATLQDPEEPSPGARMDKTYEAVTEYLKRTAGDDGAFTVSAAGRFERAAHELDRLVTRPARDALVWLHPQKTALLKPPQFESLMGQSMALAEANGFEPRRGALLFTMLKVLLGNGFHQDQQFWWAAEGLALGSTLGPEKGLLAFRDAAVRHLQTWFGGCDAAAGAGAGQQRGKA